MTDLLNGLLEYSRVGKMKDEIEVVQLKAVAQDIFAYLDKPEGFALTVNDRQLSVPRVPFEFVIRNLLSNAIKHHDKHSGKIEIGCREAGPFYHIRIRDDGPGIPPDLHHKAFEIFQTLKPKDEVEGAGIGLAIVQRIVDHYRGALSIDSDGRNGTCVDIKWPIPSDMA